MAILPIGVSAMVMTASGMAMSSVRATLFSASINPYRVCSRELMRYGFILL
jgi:hypothetical protein